METMSEHSPFEILENLEDKLQNALLSYTEIGKLLNKKPSVIAQYAKAGIIHPIQQGSKKLVKMKEVHVLKACMYAAEHYGCSYTAGKVIKTLLKKLEVRPSEYVEYLQQIEKETGITSDEVNKYVNSYRCRGIFQKQKAQEQKENIRISTKSIKIS